MTFSWKGLGEPDGNKTDMRYWCGDENQRINVTFGHGRDYHRQLRSLSKVG